LPIQAPIWRVDRGRIVPTETLQGVALLGAHLARATAHVEAAQAFEAALLEKLIPAADRVVVEQENFGHVLTAHTLIQQHQGVGAPRHATSRQTIARQRDQRVAILFTEEAASNMDPKGVWWHFQI
jgi:hypothetical protein